MIIAQSKEHPNYWVQMVLDSESPEGIRLPTIHAHMPRIILAEGNTHRVFSRNARSTRAVPTPRLIQEVRENPYMPLKWLKNKPGMQASEPMSDVEIVASKELWLGASRNAAEFSQALFNMGLHKQWAGRVIEPFMWVDWLVTSTDWNNFFALRDDAGAQPEIELIAKLIKECFARSTPQKLQPGQWHLPYIRDEDWDAIALEVKSRYGFHNIDANILSFAQQISVARCARLSYTPFDGNGSIEAELDRYDRLITAQPVHASPAEHQATPDTYIDPRALDPEWAHPELHGNFKGWQQFRKFLPFENMENMAEAA